MNDCAAELISANKERLAPFANPDHLLELLTRGVSGSKASYRQYMASYFSKPDDVSLDGSGRNDAGLGARVGRWARQIFRR